MRAEQPSHFEPKTSAEKAYALTSALQRHGISADEASDFSPDQWVVVANSAKVNPPSTMTIALVIEWLRGSEAE
jgi:hypothetical protein